MSKVEDQRVLLFRLPGDGEQIRVFYPNYEERQRVLVSEPVYEEAIRWETHPTLVNADGSKMRMERKVRVLKKEAVWRLETDDELLARSFTSLNHTPLEMSVIRRGDLPPQDTRSQWRLKDGELVILLE